jgi:hypothetical protein
MSGVTTPLALSTTSKRAFDRLAADVRRVLGPRFVALLAYGPASGVVFAASLTAGDLDAFGALVETWHREGLATPLVMTPDEFRRSLDAFPLEYQAMLDRHVLVDGHDPFGGCAIQRDDLRRACEVQARSHLLHLRQGWVEAAGHPERLADVVRRSAEPLRALLANVAHLQGAEITSADDLARFVEREAGMSADLVRAVLALEAAPDEDRQLASRLPEYLTAAERLWAFVDGWRSR